MTKWWIQQGNGKTWIDYVGYPDEASAIAAYPEWIKLWPNCHWRLVERINAIIEEYNPNAIQD